MKFLNLTLVFILFTTLSAYSQKATHKFDTIQKIPALVKHTIYKDHIKIKEITKFDDTIVEVLRFKGSKVIGESFYFNGRTKEKWKTIKLNYNGVSFRPYIGKRIKYDTNGKVVFEAIYGKKVDSITYHQFGGFLSQLREVIPHIQYNEPIKEISNIEEYKGKYLPEARGKLYLKGLQQRYANDTIIWEADFRHARNAGDSILVLFQQNNEPIIKMSEKKFFENKLIEEYKIKGKNIILKTFYPSGQIKELYKTDIKFLSQNMRWKTWIEFDEKGQVINGSN